MAEPHKRKRQIIEIDPARPDPRNAALEAENAALNTELDSRTNDAVSLRRVLGELIRLCDVETLTDAIDDALIERETEPISIVVGDVLHATCDTVRAEAIKMMEGGE